MIQLNQATRGHAEKRPAAPSVTTAFDRETGVSLKALLLHPETELSRQLHDRLVKVEVQGRCLRRFRFVTVMVLVLCLIGLGGCAIFAPETFHTHRNLLVRSLLTVGLGSLLFQAVVLGHVIGNRIATARLHRMCLCLLLARWPSPSSGVASPGGSRAVETTATAVATAGGEPDGRPPAANFAENTAVSSRG